MEKKFRPYTPEELTELALKGTWVKLKNTISIYKIIGIVSTGSILVHDKWYPAHEALRCLEYVNGEPFGVETLLKEIPFDAEKAKNGAKVITRDGKKVRIVCYDKTGSDYPIVALVKLDAGGETIISYTLSGKFSKTKISETEDLFILE